MSQDVHAVYFFTSFFFNTKGLNDVHKIPRFFFEATLFEATILKLSIIQYTAENKISSRILYWKEIKIPVWTRGTVDS